VSGDCPTFDFIPNTQLAALRNLQAFPGMLLMDKWCGTGMRRSAIFSRDSTSGEYSASFISHSCAFNGSKWNFEEPRKLARYQNDAVYRGIRGPESFEPVLSSLTSLSSETLWRAISEMPAEWSGDDRYELDELVENIFNRRAMTRDLLLDLPRTLPGLFPHWMPAVGVKASWQQQPHGLRQKPMTA